MNELPPEDALFWTVLKGLQFEHNAVAYFTKIRWRDGEFCPYCDHDRLYHLKDRRTHKCASCRRSFLITVGTIFEGTKRLHDWILAIAYLCQHGGQVGSTRLSRLLGISQKSAWLMLERLREASLTPSFHEPLPAKKLRRSSQGSMYRPIGAKSDPRFRWRDAEERSERDANDPPKHAVTREHQAGLSKRLVRSPKFWLVDSGDRNQHDEVETVLQKLHRARDLAGGSAHPSDASRIAMFFTPLAHRGYKINPEACYQWAEAHDWEDHAAIELAAIIEELCSRP